MTSDKLINQLESPARWWWSDHPKGERKIVSLAPQEAAARIRELEAELDALKSDLSGYMSAANTYVNELHGVHDGTHVIVPVEPTEAMLDVGLMVYEDAGHKDPFQDGSVACAIYRAMIRAAQPGASN